MSIRDTRFILFTITCGLSLFGCGGDTSVEPRDAEVPLDSRPEDARTLSDSGADSGNYLDGGTDGRTSTDGMASDAGPHVQGDLLWDRLYEAALPPINEDTRWVALDGDIGLPLRHHLARTRSRGA